MKKESQEKLDEINKSVKEKGFNNIETICARGEPSKISFSIHFERLPSYNVVCSYAQEMKIDTIVMGRRGMSNMER